MNLQASLRRVAAPAVAGALLALAPAGQAQEALLARNLAATCASCHGTQGHASGEIKALAGLAAARIVDTLADFRSGRQPSTVMQQIAKGYSDDQIRLIAIYFAAQQPR